MNEKKQVVCPECPDGVGRRDFLKTAGGAALAAGAAPAFAAVAPREEGEPAVKRFYESLTDAQKKEICFPFKHPSRKKVSANWDITRHSIGDKFYTAEQRTLIREVFRSVTSEDGYHRFLKQMDDDYGGFGGYTVAVFGAPGSGKFEWELTGRHLTMRADGDSVKNVAFGGPIVYGHGQGNPDRNLFYHQTRKANEVFAALDPAQRKKALQEKSPKENRVPLQGAEGAFPGVAVGELSADQKKLVEESIKVNLSPYRERDVKEALSFIKKGGGLDKLHLAFYADKDLKKDGVWDVWRIEGPSFVWHFRGAPHVHAYVNVGMKG